MQIKQMRENLEFNAVKRFRNSPAFTKEKEERAAAVLRAYRDNLDRKTRQQRDNMQARLLSEPRRSSRTPSTASRIVTMFHPVSDTRTSASHQPSSPKSTPRRITIHGASGSRTMMAGMKKSPTTDGRRPSVARLASRATVSRR